MSDLPETPADPAVPQAFGNALPPPVSEAGIAPRRALYIAAVYLLAQLAFGISAWIVVGLYYGVTRGPVTPRVVEEIRRIAVIPGAAASLIGGGLVALVMARRALPGSLREGALRPIGWCAAKAADILPASCLGVVLGAFYLFVLGRAFPPAPGQEWGPIVRAVAEGGVPRVVWAILAIGIAPPAEELLFRGVLWAGLSRGMKTWLAAAVVTLLFLLGHLSEVRGYWPAWFAISALGLLAIAVRVRAGSLLPAVALHASYNACLVAAAYLVPG